MAKFELHYTHNLSYDNKMEVDIRLDKRPSKTDYQTMIDAIALLDSLRDKYLAIPAPEKEAK